MRASVPHMSSTPVAILKSYLRAFAAVVLAMFLADGADVFSVSASDLRMWLAAGIAAVLPPVIRYLDPSDSAYGRGSDLS